MYLHPASCACNAAKTPDGWRITPGTRKAIAAIIAKVSSRDQAPSHLIRVVFGIDHQHAALLSWNPPGPLHADAGHQADLQREQRFPSAGRSHQHAYVVTDEQARDDPRPWRNGLWIDRKCRHDIDGR